MLDTAKAPPATFAGCSVVARDDRGRRRAEPCERTRRHQVRPVSVQVFVGSVRGYGALMDPASIFIIIVVAIVAAVFVVFLFFTSAGLELREDRRSRRHRRRPEHTRVENEQNVVSSPVRSRPSRSDARPGPDR
jgi:hypothetical protein